MKRLILRTLLAALAAGALVAGAGVVWSVYNKVPLPLADRCTATVRGATTTLDPERAHYAALIAGVSIKRGLPPRAASIALATAYQESGIRNLDYGHADSLGLFQQRPSKGWGSEAQVMDPWYSSAAFYAALVKVKDWRTADINDTAQAVQRSAHPEAYRQHVPDARTLASSLTGETPASFSCVVRSPGAADPAGMRRYLTKTLGGAVTLTDRSGELRVRARDASVAWSVAHQAVANTREFGLTSVQIGPFSWTHSRLGLAAWEGAGDTGATRVVVLRFG